MSLSLLKQAFWRGINNYSIKCAYTPIPAIITQLQPHQERAVDKAVGQSGAVLAHAMGSGKTLTSQAIANALGLPADVLLPAPLVANYEKEIEKHVRNGVPLNLLSMGKVQQHPELLAGGDSTLIVDEAHRLRNAGSKLYQAVRNAPYQHKILLTGTPIYNNPADIASLVNIAANEDILPNDPAEFKRQFVSLINPHKKLLHPLYLKELLQKNDTVRQVKSEEELTPLLQKWIDHYSNVDKSQYPTADEEIVEVPLSKNQTAVHQLYFSKMPAPLQRKLQNLDLGELSRRDITNPFFVQTRQVADSAKGFVTRQETSPKHRQMLADLQDNGGKTLVYSNFLKNGLYPFAKLLDRNNISYAIFHGGLTPKQRKQIVEDYNNDKYQALLVSGAGSEGLDLKGTRLVQIMEPHWNEERIQQTIARAIRYKSHAHLPEAERHVKVKRYVAAFKPVKNIFTEDADPQQIQEYVKRFISGASVEQYLAMQSLAKKEISNKIIELLAKK